MATRSSSLAKATLSGTGEVIYTTPVDRVVLLKRVTYQTEATGTSTFQVLLRDGTDGSVYLLLINKATTDPFFSEDLETWIVLEEGDQIEATMTLGTARIWLSGAELVD